MRYERLHINRFGTLHNDTQTLTDGLNTIECSTEEDKQSLAAFLRSMLFGMDPDDPEGTAAYQEFYPPTGSSTYGGVLEFTRENTTYSMYRNFYRDPRGFTLMDETNGRQVKPDREEYRQLIHGVPAPLYSSIISPGPMPAGDPAKQRALIREQICNLYSTGSVCIDTEAARRHLQKEREDLAGRYSRETDQRISEISEQIDRLTARRDELPDGSDLPAWEKQREVLQEELGALRDRHARAAQSIRSQEEYLDSYTDQMGCSFHDAEERCLRLMDRRERLLKQYPDPGNERLRPYFPALIGGSAALAVIFLLLSVLAFVKGMPLPGLAGAAAAVGAFFAIRGFVTKRNAADAYDHLESAIHRLYRELLPSITDPSLQSIDGFLDLMKELQQRKKALNEDRGKFERLTGEITLMTEKEDRLLSRLRAKKEEFRRKVQLSEQICQLESDLEALEPLRRRNASILEDIAAVDLAMDTLEELVSRSFAAFAERILTEASGQLSAMTSGRCDMLHIDSDGDIILEQDMLPRPLASWDPSVLPKVLLTLRTAFIQTLVPGTQIPLVLDESFLPAAPDREEVIRWLQSSYPGQILLLTTVKNPA